MIDLEERIKNPSEEDLKRAERMIRSHNKSNKKNNISNKKKKKKKNRYHHK